MERAAGGAVERGLVVEDDVHGDRGDEGGGMPAFVFEGAHESAVFQLGNDLRRDTAADVDASQRFHNQGEVAGHSAVDFDEQFEGLHYQLRLFRERRT